MGRNNIFKKVTVLEGSLGIKHFVLEADIVAAASRAAVRPLCSVSGARRRKSQRQTGGPSPHGTSSPALPPPLGS